MSELASESSAQCASLGGRELAADLRRRTAESAAALTAAGRPPRLAIVVATADESSAWYVRSIAKAAAAVGIVCDIVSPALTEIHTVLTRLGADDDVHGIILQTPLPSGIDAGDLTPAIPPAKDVDGANPASLGRLAAGLPAFPPATAEAVLALLDHHGVALAGRHAVVVGRSTVVGKPAAHLLLDRDATVTICHSRTSDLAAITRQADVLVAAVGRPGLITPEHVSPGTVVIDVGTNPTADGGLGGDPAVAETAAGLTPVPGGVGPVTTALLLQHTVRAAGGP
jgi:methylenetetrahydrofolate dehydrogenase (NADP+)/methenyltetrahydrofolate cyclohydrolase